MGCVNRVRSDFELFQSQQHSLKIEHVFCWGSQLRGRFLLVMGERSTKFLGSAGLLLIVCTNRETLQFGPNLDQNYKTLHILILCKDFLNSNLLV